MSVPFASAVEALLAPGARQVNDESTFRDLQVSRHGDVLPPGLTLTWLGTASFRLAHGGYELLVDPYVTRPGLRATLGRGPLHANPALEEKYVPRADAILVGHTHFDHALDVPLIAKTHGARILGSSSCGALLRLHGLGNLGVEVVPGRVYPLGPFEVTFVESAHSKLALGLDVLYGGELSCEHLDDLRGSAYRCGATYGIFIRAPGATFYHQGSANLVDANVVHRDVDYFLCGVAGRGFTPRYLPRILSRLSPRVVVAHHFDDFFRPLGKKMGFSLNVNLGGFAEEVRRVSADIPVRTLRALEPWGGARRTPTESPPLEA